MSTPTNVSEKVTPGEPETDWFDVPGLAAWLDVKECFVRRLVRERRIPFYKVGKYIRFRLTDVLAWLDRERRESLR